jgi:hypothetical protein
MFQGLAPPATHCRPLRGLRTKCPSAIRVRRWFFAEPSGVNETLSIGVGKARVGPPLPPNRAGGSPAHGFPVGGLTSKRIGEPSMGRGQVHQPLLWDHRREPMASPRREGRQQLWSIRRRLEPRHVCAARSGAGSPYRGYGQYSRFVFRRVGRHRSTSLHPFAPPALPGFDATMGALTPARRLFVSLSGTVNSAWARAGLSASCAGPSDHSASNHPLAPPIALTRYPSAREAAGSHRFGLRRLLAGSPHEQAESSSLALRTGRSPPDAPHPASRRRSFHRLQAGERLPEEDSHLSDLAHSQTH